MRTFLILALLIISLNAQSLHHELMDLIKTKPVKDQFKLWHYALQRPYELNSEVALQKYKVFKQNLKLIDETNSKNLGYTLGLGPFTDLSAEEFAQTLNLKAPEGILAEQNKEISFDELADEEDDHPFIRNLQGQTQKSKNWEGHIPYIKDQSYCGACWAFASVAVIEAATITQGKGQILSEQNMVDCDYSNHGCNGGWFSGAFEFAKTKGLSLQSSYPYTARNGLCKSVAPKVIVNSYDFCSSFTWNKRCTDQIQLKLLDESPLAVAIEVRSDLAHYRQGDWYSDLCTQVNHGVIVVSMEILNQGTTISRYTIRNSWGKYWGKNGHGDIVSKTTQRLKACGVSDHAYIPKTVTILS